MFIPLRKFLASGLLLTLFIAAPHANAGAPCCSIVGIDGNVVTARDIDTDTTFTFTVNDSAQLAKLKAGQTFTPHEREQWVSGKGSSRKIDVPNDVPKRGIPGKDSPKKIDNPSQIDNVGEKLPPDRTPNTDPDATHARAVPPTAPGAPCCSIISIKGNVVGARESATGKTFSFTVNDKAALANLRIGQAFSANERAAWSRGGATSTSTSRDSSANEKPKDISGIGPNTRSANIGRNDNTKPTPTPTPKKKKP